MSHLHDRRSRSLLTRLADRVAGDRHSAGMTLALHLVPGALFTAAAVVLARQAARLGLPPVFGLYAATLLALVPVQLSVIGFAAKLRTGSWNLRGALRYTEKLPTRQLTVLALATLLWAAVSFGATGPASETIRISLFDWWPLELDYEGHLRDPEGHGRALLLAAWVMGAAITSILAPIVEELYFRGFLLPRLEHLGRWAPVVNTSLFAAYHLWSPWLAPSRIVATFPLFYATWRTRAITLAIVVHVALNLVGDTLASIPIVFGRA